MEKPSLQLLEVREPGVGHDERAVWLAVHRHAWQRSEPEGVQEAGITLMMERCDVARGEPGFGDTAEFCGYYDGRQQRVSITGRHLDAGAVDLPKGLRGLHLGSYAMSEVARWAKQWSDATVEPIFVSDGDAYPENHARRNRLYAQLGLQFAFEDPDGIQGRSLPMPTSQLCVPDSWTAFVTEHPMLKTFAEHVQAVADLKREQRWSRATVDGFVQRQRWADEHPLRACLGRLWVLHRMRTYLLFIAGLFALALWRAL